MPSAYQRKRSKEIQMRNSHMNSRVVAYKPNAPKNPVYEVKVGQVGGKPNWWPEAKVRAQWPQLCSKLGMSTRDLESYIRQNRRAISSTENAQ